MLLDSVLLSDDVQSQIKRLLSSASLPHATLLLGRDGYGTLPAAWGIAQALLSKAYSTQSPLTSAAQKVMRLVHPDLMMVYPTFAGDKGQDAEQIQEGWKSLVRKKPYSGLDYWRTLMPDTTKRLSIPVSTIEQILAFLSTSPAESVAKVVLIWRIDLMSATSTNKLLKMIEEPPPNTYFVCTAESTSSMLPTILSRMRILPFSPIYGEKAQAFVARSAKCDPEQAKAAVSNAEGDIGAAISTILFRKKAVETEKMFARWLRSCYAAKFTEINTWVEELARQKQESIKAFLLFGLEIFRQAFLYHIHARELVRYIPLDDDFKFERFSAFVHLRNIDPIQRAISEAYHHIERSVHPQLTLIKLSIELARLIRKKPRAA